MTTSLNMSFCDTLEGLVGGKKATRLEWRNLDFYIILLDEKLVIHKPDGLFYPLIVSLADIVGIDWVFID